jgi:hypothetical protein
MSCGHVAVDHAMSLISRIRWIWAKSRGTSRKLPCVICLIAATASAVVIVQDQRRSERVPL